MAGNAVLSATDLAVHHDCSGAIAADEARQIVSSLDFRQFEAREEFEDALACALLLKQPALANQIFIQADERFPSDPTLAELKLSANLISSTSGTDNAWLNRPAPVGVAVRRRR